MVETTNDWIQLTDGSAFDYHHVLNGGAPGDESKYLPIIAKALSHICRYTGHCKEPYSVAQHAVLTSYIGHPNIQYACLHHDDAEIVLSDMNTILKRVLNERSADAWKNIEKPIESWFADTMKVDGWRDPGVKTADLIALQVERLWFMGKSDKPWHFFDDPTVNMVNINTELFANTLARIDPTERGLKLTVREENYNFSQAWSSSFAAEIYMRRHEELLEGLANAPRSL